MNKKTIKKVIRGVLIAIMVLFIAFMFEVGLGKWGLWGFIALTLIVAGVRLYLGWDMFMRVVDMGATQLKYMKKINEEEKKNGK